MHETEPAIRGSALAASSPGVRPSGPLVLVDDDPDLRYALERTLSSAGYDVRSHGDAESALASLLRSPAAVVVADLRLPGMSGIELLSALKRAAPETEVVLITGHADVDSVVEAMRLGAYDFVEKPVDRDRLLLSVRRALDRHALRAENLQLRRRLSGAGELSSLVGESPAMRRVKELVLQVREIEVPVLITGESGTGKELVAEAIHALSPRRDGPLIRISCAAIPENLLESELFGYERGAFTGALRGKPGRFELAHGGTLFLDEIGEMAPAMQAKLLRALEDGVVLRLGGTRETTVDVRVVSATNVDIALSLEDGRFRQDLYHRLNLIEIPMPPLRERAGDVPLLAARFLELHGSRRTPPVERISPEALARLESHDWPGNVREFENVIVRAVALATGPVLTESEIRFVAGGARRRGHAPAAPPGGGPAPGDVISIPAGTSLEETERILIEDALRRCGGNREKAARRLGISSRTLYRRVRSGPGSDPSTASAEG